MIRTGTDKINAHIDFTRVFDILEYQQKKFPQKKALTSFHNGAWRSHSIDEIIANSDRVCGWLMAQGLDKGDRVAIVPKMGSPEWMIIDFACQKAGLVVVPIHPTSTAEESAFILKETEARMCITNDHPLFEKIASLRASLPSLAAVYHLDTGEAGCMPLLNEVSPSAREEEVQKRKGSVSAADTLVIMYTSGTTGKPKGIILSHENVVSNVKSVLTLFPLYPGHRVLSFLPFSHVFERTSAYAYMAFGTQLFFTQSIEKLREDFRSVQPYFCTSVPRTLEKMYDYLLEQREERNFLKKTVITWGMRVGEQYKDSARRGFLFGIKLFFARLLVLNIWRRALGGNMRYIVVGAAALRPEIARLFSAAKVTTLCGYGMTEASPFISVNRYLPGLNRFGTVGLPIPGVQIKIDAMDEKGEGEILVRGPNIMQGYYLRPDLTREVLTEDGWLRTGDVGKITGKRFLVITDRKKDIFKTSSGKYIAPQPLEAHLVSSPFVSQCLVVGFNKPFIIAVLVPHFVLLRTWCEEHGVHWTSPKFMVHNIKVVKKYQEEVERLNETLQGHEKVRSFILSEEEWSVENKDLTTSFKLMRGRLEEKYKASIEKLYAS